jgi:hypothetical protein
MAVLLAAPTSVSAPVQATGVFRGLQSSWLSWEGVEVDLLPNRSGLAASGVVLTNGGLRGFGPPPFTRYSSAGPATSGSQYRGFIANEREVFWPLLVYSPMSSDAWLHHDSRLWRSFRPDKWGRWTVTPPGRESRFLDLRFVDDGNQAFDRDPVRAGWQLYGLNLVAEQPYWQGQRQTARFVNVTPVATFPGPPFVFTEGGSTQRAAIANPGDVDAYPVHRIYGPTTSVTVGVGSDVTSFPFVIPDGTSVTLDTDPRRQTAIDSAGVDRIAELGTIAFPPVEPGRSVALTVTIAGAGSVETYLDPLYFRAWG